MGASPGWTDVVDRVFYSVSSDWMVSKCPCRCQVGDRGCIIAKVGEDSPLIAVQPGAGAILWLEAAQGERRTYRADPAKGRVRIGDEHLTLCQLVLLQRVALRAHRCARNAAACGTAVPVRCPPPSGIPAQSRVLGGGPVSAGTHCAHGGKGIHYQWASHGGMAERLIAAVLKTARGVRPSGVRIPLPPLDMRHETTRGAQLVATSCVIGKWPAAGV
jgi:hypothetical protein